MALFLLDGKHLRQSYRRRMFPKASRKEYSEVFCKEPADESAKLANTAQLVSENSPISLLNLPPTPGQSRLALAVSGVLFAGFCIVAPFADTPLMRLEAYIPSLEAVMVLSDFITSVLLFAHFSIYRSRALLALGSGYLYTALIVIPHLLSFPGAFSPTGLLGAHLQTTAWLYDFWHIGFPVALLAYALMKDEHPAQSDTRHHSTLPAISWSVGIVLSVVSSLTWLATQGHDYLPRLFLDRTTLLPLAHYVAEFMLLICGTALSLLWIRRRSVLDQWLEVACLALIFELVLVAVLSNSRFTLGSYSGRIFSLVTSTVVLVVLLSETTRLYARLARWNVMLQRERANKLMNVQAITAAIAHEVRQPLAAIAANSGAARRFLKKSPPDYNEVEAALDRITSDSHRTSEVLDGLRALFRKADHGREPIAINKIVQSVVQSMQGELKDHNVELRSELTVALPLIKGHKAQLQEVILNLVRNAIEAMDMVSNHGRVLRVTTQLRDRDAISVTVQDSGPGIDPKRLDKIFTAFSTTKSDGTGLGLAICRMIIEHHGGQLTALSDGMNGAIFQFNLPVKPAHDEKAI